MTKIGLRLHYHSLIDDKGYEILMDFCEKYRDQIDELSLFNHYSLQGYIAPEEDARINVILKKRMDDMRKRGFKSVGINVLSTLGHGNETYDSGKPLAPMMVGYNGEVAEGTFCPATDEFKQYIYNRYRGVAEAGPDFVWADDDCRMYSNGVKYGCFCDKCMGIFNERVGGSYTRESLVAALESPDNTEVRGQWVSFVTDRMVAVFEILRKAVSDVDPSIETGYMHTGSDPQTSCWYTYNGMAYDKWMTALGATKGRPGTTIFDDLRPKCLLEKGLVVGRTLNEYPDSVVDRLAEHDNYPYPTYRKSHTFEISECTAYLANGCNGLYLNSMNDRSINVIQESEPLFQLVRKIRGRWDTMTDFEATAGGYGFYPALSRDFDKRRKLRKGDSFFTPNAFNPNDARHAITLAQAGVPITCDEKKAFGTILYGSMPDGYTDEQLLAMLSKPMFIDAYALMVLEERGLGKYTGVKINRIHPENVIAHHNMDDPINYGVTEDYRDTRGFGNDYGGGQFNASLVALDDSVRVVSYLEGFQNQPYGIATSIYENSLGGKICVLGYSAACMMDAYTTRTQINRICDVITDGKMRSKILTGALAAQFVRQSNDGKSLMVTLLNMSIDPIENCEIAVYGAKKAVLLGDYGEKIDLAPRFDGEYAVFTVPYTYAFSTNTIIAE